MSLFLGILLALFVFLVIVFIHELGHFLVARWCKVRVQEFGLGIPPKMLTYYRDAHGTDWTLNWLPLGGFVRLKGEDTTAPESRDVDAFARAVWWKQLAILVAGVVMNFLLAGLILSFLFWRGTESLHVHIREEMPASLFSQIKTGTELIPIYDTWEQARADGVVTLGTGVQIMPLPGSPAEKAWIHAGDMLRTLNGIAVTDFAHLRSIVAESATPLTAEITRATGESTLLVTPQDGKIGVFVRPNFSLTRYQYDFFPSLWHGFTELWSQIRLSFDMFGAMLSRLISRETTEAQKQEIVHSVGWPVAIGKVFVGIVDNNPEIREILVIMALLSISLGVFNLLPIPALDGGRALIVIVNQLIHWIAPKYKISPRLEQIIHSAGFLCLILLSLLITYKDIFW
jgi:regulator of sigma E protease